MANVAVKKASEQNQNANEQQQALTRQKGGEVTGRGFWDPLSSLTPSEFFSSNPFSLMRRFTEEMDRTFSRFFQGQGEESFWSPAIEVTQNEGQLKGPRRTAGPETGRCACRSDERPTDPPRRTQIRARGEERRRLSLRAALRSVLPLYSTPGRCCYGAGQSSIQ